MRFGRAVAQFFGGRREIAPPVCPETDELQRELARRVEADAAMAHENTMEMESFAGVHASSGDPPILPPMEQE